MKNILSTATLFFLAILIFSCKPCPECPEAGNDTEYQADDVQATLKDTISESTYNTWKTNWKTDGQAFTANTLTEYFTLPLIDINEFLEFPGTGRDSVVASRFVLGLEIDGTDTTAHIMLVGVNAAGESLTNASLQQYVYDVSAPCPNSCGASSLTEINK